jgi:hypothetical protein
VTLWNLAAIPSARPLEEELSAFREFGSPTVVRTTSATAPDGRTVDVPTFVNEFWTSRQRAASSLHEVSYRACFKPQLPRFFIDRLTEPGDTVHDPFMGRGTTPVEAALAGRRAVASDVNPLALALCAPRLDPPALAEVENRLSHIPLESPEEVPRELEVFFHPHTLEEICALKEYLEGRELDRIDAWIRMVALNRLTGHSPGFFSVYSLPPNQAASVQSQRKINERRKQVPPRRPVKELIVKKSASLLRDVGAEQRRVLAGSRPALSCSPAAKTPFLSDGEVDLVVTSPPFLNVVNYQYDNWLRCWFAGIDPASVRITAPRRLEEWQRVMTEAFRELSRVVRPGGHVAFEVGEVCGGEVRLEEASIPCALEAGLVPVLVLVNAQVFTKTAHCWGVRNTTDGTNSNRVLLLRRPG